MKRNITLLLVVLGLAGCSGTASRPIISNETSVLLKSLTIPAEAVALAAAGYIPANAAAAGVAAYFVVDPLSPNWQIEEARMGENRFRIALRKKRFTTGGDGEATQIFYRRAEQIVRENGFAAYTVLEFGEGVESTVPIAQRVAQGIIQVK
jgi:hypothetical protein